MAASIKFLVPFSLFVGLGGLIAPRDSAPVPPPQMRFVMADSIPPVPLSALPKIDRSTAPVHRDWRPLALGFLWFCGCACILIRWHVRWRRAASQLRASLPWNAPPEFPRVPVPLRSSPSVLEPGVFGIFRPVLLLPAGIEARLSAAQLQAIFAHELCHIRRSDNLAAAVHMLVESIFWFHPLVWWIGARLVEEREIACDEEVLRLGSDPAIYAQSILEICRFGLESPVACISGIAGADLARRIRGIMAGRARRPLEPAKKLLLIALGAAAVAAPIAIGLAHPPKLRAQSPPQTAAPLSFDVASVKVSDLPYLVVTPKRSGGRITWTTDLTYILGYAYHLQPWRMLGPIPGSDHIYSVEATTSPDATDEQVRLMFQSLLIDRFQMKVHRETKDVEGYALTVARSGLKIQEARDGSEPAPLPEWFHGRPGDAAAMEGHVAATLPSAGVVAITGRRVTMLQVCESLQRVLGGAVVDHTNLEAKYYFAFQFAQNDNAPDNSAPALSVALRDLGLKLDKYKGPVEMLVVDHIEKTPTGN